MKVKTDKRKLPTTSILPQWQQYLTEKIFAYFRGMVRVENV
jgi:hypothetical protein